MRKFLLCVALASASLSACAITPATVANIPTAPVVVADTTKTDEQVAITAELAYKTWRIAVEAGVKSGVIKGKLAHNALVLDNQLYAALQVIENGYGTANATTLHQMLTNFNTTLAAGYAVIGGK